jgi:hypothetical protein
MDRRAFVAGATSFLGAPLAAEAQPQAGKVYRVFPSPDLGRVGAAVPLGMVAAPGVRDYGRLR